MTNRLGIAPDSWGIWFPDDPSQAPWHQFLDEVVLAGFGAIELGPFGYLPSDSVVLAAELERRSLTLAGGFFTADLDDPETWEKQSAELFRVCRLLRDLDAEYIGVIPATYSHPITGRLTRSREMSEDGWRRCIDLANRIGEVAAEHGVRALFHQHADSPIEYEEQIARLLDSSDPALIGLLHDVGHHAYRGGDPIAFVHAYSERLGGVHIKTVDSAVRDIVMADDLPISQAVKRGAFTEPQLGVVDFVKLREALRAVGFDGWTVVEQDMYPASPDKPLPIARRTYRYLREIGY
jgi:inosose dehydratase